MIPPLNEHGYLPPGVHPATLEEVIQRFGHGSEQREAQGQSLLWLEPICRRARITRILINGSFVSDRLEPNDADCALLAASEYDESTTAAKQLLQGLPFLELHVVNEEDYRFFIGLYSTDRDMISKGMVEVVL